MPTRSLPFPVFDADNHMYETREALTKHLPPGYEQLIDYVEVKGRTKIMVKGRVSDYIPNPTFDRVAAPGAQEDYFKRGNPEGRSTRDVMGPAIESVPAYRSPEPRLELMDELGIDRTIMWPTLASLVEERLRDDPHAAHIVVHALNQWMYEQWSFNFEDRIFATPVITLPILDNAVAELEWVLDRGARVILIRPAPVPGFRGSRSFALPEYDPFWKRVNDAGILVGMHSSDSGYQRYANEWEGVPDGEFTPFSGGSAFAAIVGHENRPIRDSVASLIGHGLCSRFTELRFAPVENGSHWVRPVIEAMAEAYALNPQFFSEDPISVFKRNFLIHPFHEEDPSSLAELVGVENVIFGSDYPHPEGLADPISFVDELGGFSEEEQAKIMGGNLARVLGVTEHKAA